MRETVRISCTVAKATGRFVALMAGDDVDDERMYIKHEAKHLINWLLPLPFNYLTLVEDI